MSKELVGYLSPELTLVGTLSQLPSDITVKLLNATENGVYQEDGVAYSPVTVDVEGLVPTGTKRIVENGEYEVFDYAMVDVNVSDGLPFAGGVYF